MSLKARLSEKRRARVAVPVQLDDATQAESSWAGASMALQAARVRNTSSAELQVLEEAVQAAQAEYDQHFALIELEALGHKAWERVYSEAQGEDGKIDWDKYLPSLLALSCVDPELKDRDLWAQWLAEERFTAAEVDSMKMAMLRVNTFALDHRVPKD